MSAALASRVDNYIAFPITDAAFRSLKENIFQVAGYPNVLGAIDGTVVPIKGPSVDKHLYVGRKGYGQVKGWLLGDSAYPLRPWLLTTILNPVG